MLTSVTHSALAQYQRRAQQRGRPVPQFAAGQVVVVESDGRLVLVEASGYQVIADLQPDPGRGTLGLTSLQRHGLPEALGLVQPIPATPVDPPLGAHCGLALSFGPAYKDADAAWVPLASVPAEWGDYAVTVLSQSAAAVAFEIEYRIGGGPILSERYQLSLDGIEYQTRIDWMIGGFRLQVPLFLTDGKTVATPRLNRNELTLTCAGHSMHVAARDPEQHWEFDGQPYANAVGMYQNAYLQGRSVIQYDVLIRID